MEAGRLLEEVSNVEKKKWQRTLKREQEQNPVSVKDFQIPVAPALRRKGVKRGKLSVGDKTTIAYQAIVKKWKYADIAKEFRTSVSAVCRLVNKIMKNKNALDEIYSKRDAVDEQRAAVKGVVEDMVASNAHIDSAKTVQKMVKNETQLTVPVNRIQKFMSKDFDLTFAKIKNISLHANSVKNLVLR